MFVTRATRAPRANYRGVLLGALGYPADVENLANTLELARCFIRNGARAAVTVAAGFDSVDCFHSVDILRAQRGCQVDADAKNMWVTCRVLAANRLATVKPLVFA